LPLAGLAEAAELARQYQEMDDREIMRGVVYETPTPTIQ